MFKTEKQQTQQSQSVPAQQYKTEMCRAYAESGVCRYSSRCQFAHGEHEMRSVQRHPKWKTERCKKFESGVCPYGIRCRFLHGPEDSGNATSGANGNVNAASVPSTPLPPVAIANTATPSGDYQLPSSFTSQQFQSLSLNVNGNGNNTASQLFTSPGRQVPASFPSFAPNSTSQAQQSGSNSTLNANSMPFSPFVHSMPQLFLGSLASPLSMSSNKDGLHHMNDLINLSATNSPMSVSSVSSVTSHLSLTSNTSPSSSRFSSPVHSPLRSYSPENDVAPYSPTDFIKFGSQSQPSSRSSSFSLFGNSSLISPLSSAPSSPPQDNSSTTNNISSNFGSALPSRSRLPVFQHLLGV